MLPKRAIPLTGLLLVPMVSWGFSYQAPEMSPEVGSGYEEKPGWAVESFAVAAANPLATDAGYQVLKAGGNAIDAAVAVQMVLTLVEPQSSGIGGGAFLMHYDGSNVQAFDGRETAPSAATGELFMEDGEPLPFMDAVASGLSVGVPGVLRMLEQAHAEHGQLARRELFTLPLRWRKRALPSATGCIPVWPTTRRCARTRWPGRSTTMKQASRWPWATP